MSGEAKPRKQKPCAKCPYWIEKKIFMGILFLRSTNAKEVKIKLTAKQKQKFERWVHEKEAMR